MAHNFTGLNIKHENFRKGIFMDPYDEPTYLTFAIDFKFEETPVHNPTAEAGLSNSPLFQTGNSNSAIDFLMNRGYNPQADGLATFREILRYLTFQAPWYFQSISGLSNMFSDATDQTRGFKTKGTVLEIDTLEALDLRIFELAGLYRNAIYDNKFRRERVPDNLRWFSMDVYVAEWRNLRYRIPGIGQESASILGIDTGAIGNIAGGGNIISNVMDQFGYIKFECRQCEFDFSDTFPAGKNINIGQGGGKTAETNGFKINIGWFNEEAKFGDGSKINDDYVKTSISNPWGGRKLGGAIQNAGSFLSGLPVIGDDITAAGQSAMNGLSQIGGLLNPALTAASQFINPPITEIGDRYDTGYESNGDKKPDWKTPNNGNIY
jgi:hypothetical protein